MNGDEDEDAVMETVTFQCDRELADLLRATAALRGMSDAEAWDAAARTWIVAREDEAP